MPTSRTIKVFIASPSDLAIERRAFKDTMDNLNKGFGVGADVVFEPLAWEDALYPAGRRPQSVINRDVDACEIFILVMWRRWGQEAPEAAPYSSYTEEEFYRALARYEKTGTPIIYVLLKHIDPGQMADPGDQLKKVLEFRKKLEASRRVFGRGFTDEKDFVTEIERHLIAFVKTPPDAPSPRDVLPILPDSVQAEIERHKQNAQKAFQEIEKLRKEAQQSVAEAEQVRAEARDLTTRSHAAEVAAEAKAAARSLDLAELAAKAALEGKIEAARQSFAKALEGTTSLQVLYLGYEFFDRIGELDEAERLLKRWLAISGRDRPTADTAAALSNLGLIAKTRGNLAEAEILHRQALVIVRKLGWVMGQAVQLGNLGTIAQIRGDLNEAATLHRESLDIDRQLGRLEGQATQLGNLGNIARRRGDLASAEKLCTEALQIYRPLGHLENQAKVLGNLGTRNLWKSTTSSGGWKGKLCNSATLAASPSNAATSLRHDGFGLRAATCTPRSACRIW
jgi:tetratricopeptide (TPR) repeat protein